MQQDLLNKIIKIRKTFFENDSYWESNINYFFTIMELDWQIIKEGLKFDFSNDYFSLMDYEKALINTLGCEGSKIINNLKKLAKQLHTINKTKIVLFNATYQGGGVAEMMQTMGYILKELGIELLWYVIYPDNKQFYNITKKIHNIIQGNDITITDQEIEEWDRVNKLNYEIYKQIFTDDKIAMVFIEDPQVLPLVKYIKQNYPTLKVSWRLHIDTSGAKNKNKNALQLWHTFLHYLSYLSENDIIMFQPFSRICNLNCVKGKLVEQEPGIDILKSKNIEMSEQDMQYYIDIINKESKTNINCENAYLVTGSRFDYWKGLATVIKVFDKLADKYKDVNLIVFGNYADDDPEGVAYYNILQQIRNEADNKNKIIIVCNYDGAYVGSLYKLAGEHGLPFIAYSFKEGYNLMVNEAISQSTLVLTTNVGGLKRFIDNENAFVVEIDDVIDNCNVSNFYKLEDEKIKTSVSATILEKRLYNKLDEILKLRKNKARLYDKKYKKMLMKAKEQTYLKSLLTMISNYLYYANN